MSSRPIQLSRTPRRALLLGCAVLPLLAAPAMCATPHRAPQQPVVAYDVSLQDATAERTVRTLDWRTPAVELRFDLSQADTVRDLALSLSADPLPGVDPSLPITVQFNNGKPMTIAPRGRGFDAELSLSPLRARETNNVLRLSHAVPCGTRSGGYTLNLDQSRLRLSARPKRRSLQLREVESRFAASAFAPGTVGLVADGPMATRLQALGAQAVGLRMSRIPDFRTTTARTDFDIVMMRRDQLHRYTDDIQILGATGPRVSLSRAHPDRLFLTGDTDTEVLSTVRAFATHYLPRSRRSHAAPGELFVQSPLDYRRTRIDGDVRLDALSVTTGAMREYTFDVADPAATGGDLVLRLTRDAHTPPGARLRAVLNGESLGEARMDARRKTVSYPITPSQLRGGDNRLELTTKAGPDSDACAGDVPFIAIGAGSRLRLDAERPSAATDLSRVAATGSVFAAGAGADTAVMLPEGDADYRAALRVVARLGAATGHGWSAAQWQRGVDASERTHTLVLAPFDEVGAELTGGAPRGLQSAWRGQPVGGSNRLASVERFASLDADTAVRLAARRQRAAGEVGAGGVAAVFAAPSGGVTGVFSNTPGRSFAASMEPLASQAHWNGLSGGVARWNDRAVVMAQAAITVPGLGGPAETEAGPTLLQRIAKLEQRDLTDWTWPDFDIPELSRRDVVDGARSAAQRAERWVRGLGRSNTPAPTPAPSPATAPAPEAAPVASPVASPGPAAPVSVAVAAAPSVPAPTLKSSSEERSRPALKLRGPIDLGAVRKRVSQAERPRLPSTARLRQGVSSWVRSMEVRSSRLRSQWRSRTGWRAPSLKGLRVGGYEIPGAVLLLVLASLLTLVALAFVNSRSHNGSHH